MRDPSRSTVITVIVCGVVFVVGYLLGAANTRRAIMHGVLPQAATAGGGPRLQPHEAVHDFGVIAHDGVLQHTFRVTNTGNAELVFGNVEAACGCTVATLSAPALAPRASADLVVTFNAKDQHGQVDKEIEIESNDAAAPFTTLHLTGRVMAPGETAPSPTASGAPAGARTP